MHLRDIRFRLRVGAAVQPGDILSLKPGIYDRLVLEKQGAYEALCMPFQQCGKMAIKTFDCDVRIGNVIVTGGELDWLCLQARRAGRAVRCVPVMHRETELERMFDLAVEASACYTEGRLV